MALVVMGGRSMGVLVRAGRARRTSAARPGPWPA
jgi:hypothetical protein